MKYTTKAGSILQSCNASPEAVNRVYGREADKPKDMWTLKEVREHCKNNMCVNCPFIGEHSLCIFTDSPVYWKL